MSKALRLIGVLAMATLPLATSVPIAGAIPPPVIDPNVPPPPDGPPAPEKPMEQRYYCQLSTLRPDTDPRQVSAAQEIMKLPQLWDAAGKGSGVSVALIDTGVTPSARLPHLRGGGDYVDARGDGLSDCDAHGTMMAGIIAASASKDDAFSGVAPDAEVISIRHDSAAFQEVGPWRGTIEHDDALVRTMAKDIVQAANTGAKVIVVGVSECFWARRPLDQSQLGAAVRYAAVDKDAVIVAAAGNTGQDCRQNPDVDLANKQDPRNWNGVQTIATPSWFDDHVLTVGAPEEFSLRGPWVDVAAPASGIVSVGPEGTVADSFDFPDEPRPISGTSFSAAYVAGLAALIRSKYPDLTAAQVTERIVSTAQNPSGHVDNQLGHGLIDPVAAVGAAPQPQKRSATAVYVGAASVLAVLVLGSGFWWLRRRRRSA